MVIINNDKTFDHVLQWDMFERMNIIPFMSKGKKLKR